MVWIICSLGTAIIITFVNIIDSHVLSKKMPGLSSYLLPLGLTQFVIAAVFLVIFPFPANPGLVHVLVAFASAMGNALSLVIALKCLQKGEVSRVIAVTSSYPIFVALLSVPLLGEFLNIWEWLAVFMTVVGTVLVSLHHEGGRGKARLQKSFVLLLVAAVLTAVSNIGFKYALGTISFWNMVSINCFAVAVVVLCFSLRRATFTELKNLPQRAQKLGLIIGNQCIAVAGITVGFIATANGPIALVSTIMNIRPVFIFIFSLILSRFYPGFLNERLDKRTILMKVAGIAMITAGVAIIGLSGT